MRIFMTKPFTRFAGKNTLGRDALRNVVDEIARGLVDADLGGGLLKKRVARPGEGKSGGFRTILAYRTEDRTIFVYGFAKNERDNIRGDELRALKALAKELLSYSTAQLDQAMAGGALMEVRDDE